MKIVIIETRSSRVHVYTAVPIPRIGSVLLGTILRDRGHDVKVFIEEMGDVDFDVVRDADLVGISVVTSTSTRSYQIARRVREMGVPVVFGGTHVSFEPDEALSHGDFVVRGEGEETFVELVEAFAQGGGYESIAGLSWRDGEVAVHNPDRPRLENLDVNPIPDYSLVRGKRSVNVITMETGRGCPFECTFCTVPTFNGRGIRTRSVELVLEEIEFHTRRKLGFLFFADDNFNIKRKRMRSILEGMLQRNVKVRWGAQVRHELSRDAESLELMRRAGCGRVFVGFESINPRTLELFKKHETREDVIEAIQGFHKHGIKIHGMFVVGSDEDTLETIVETRKFAEKYGIDSLQMMVLTPMPGTLDLERYKQSGRRILTTDWSFFDGHHAVHEPRKMTPYDLEVGAATAMRDFYSIKSIASRLLRGDLVDAVIRMYGFKLTRQWFRDPENIAHTEALRQSLYQGIEELGIQRPAEPKRSVVLAASGEARKTLEVFFRELGVKVTVTRDNILSALGESGNKIAEGGRSLSDHVQEFLDGFKGKTDLIVVTEPQEEESPLKERWAELKALASNLNRSVGQWPQLVHLSGDTRDRAAAVMASLGLIFTEDIALISRASAKALMTA